MRGGRRTQGARRLTSLLGLCGLGLAWPTDSRAEDPAESTKPRIQQDTVRSVTLGRHSVFESARSASATEGIDLSDELRVTPPRSVGDMLRDKDTLFVQQPSYSVANASLRGLGEGRVALYVDDVRLTTTTTSTLPGGLTNLNLVDPYTVRGIEVVRGPGLATYGDGGLGGTIVLRTLRPTAIADSPVELTAGARGIYSSPDQGVQGSVTGAGRWNRFALEAAFSARRFREVLGGSSTASAPQPYTGYSDGGLYLGLGVDTGRGTLTGVYQGLRQYDAIRSERSQGGDVYSLPEVGRDLGYLRYDGDFEAAGRPVEVHATVSFQRQSELSVRQVVAVDRSLRQQNHVDVLGVSSRLRSDLGRGGILGAGFESNFEWVGSTAERSLLHEGAGGALLASPMDARYPGGSRAQTFAFFVQDDLDLIRLFTGNDSDPPGKLRALVAGRAGGSFLYIPQDARLSQLRPTVELLDERQQARPVYSGSLHLRYEPIAGLALVGGGMVGVRPPNLDDQARLDDGRPGLLLPTRVALNSESAYSAEASIRTAYRRLEGSVTYAFTYLDSPILMVPVTLAGEGCILGFDGRTCSPLFSRANAQAASLHSIEAVARVYLLWGLSAFASVGYTRPDTTTSGEATLPRVPPVHGVAAVEFRRPRTIFNFVQLLVRWAGPQRLMAAEDLWDPTLCPTAPNTLLCSGTPGFLLVSLRSALRLSRQIQLTAAIDNITNESYRFHGSGIDGAGIGARLGLDANY